MKLADGWLLSAFSCRQAFILEVEVSQVFPHTPCFTLIEQALSAFFNVNYV